MRLIEACLDLHHAYPHRKLRDWAHMLGFRGHFSTKSRRYSTTLGALRQVRADYRAAQQRTALGLPDPDDHPDATTLTLAHWTYMRPRPHPRRILARRQHPPRHPTQPRHRPRTPRRTRSARRTGGVGMKRPLPDRYLTPVDLADLLGVPVETVYQWRRKETGPRGFRVGKHLRYDPEDVRAWVASLLEGAA